MLNSENLKKTIKKIDETRSSMKFKLLNDSLKSESELNDFCQMMLSEMGYLDSEGRFSNK